ncbi:unnamed protein product [Prorocentrum cordatum]|uniref:PITH domain-containing protein n=1 Tax=Prorocentrum cordatum TaxID=2364126 RepID=A0ABN9Y0A8_9DINO|nr:unnamed protein product [Polarella glacialis]|mmetsp:Transcript_70899/g.190109  ORF Transcript_70899/g.190109 Transcript_70899/m.190109 type:complete len:217 (-) Transcript_70899:40-690(-)
MVGYCAQSHDAEFPDDNWNLYQHIDTESSAVLNATVAGASAGEVATRGSLAAVLRPHERRFLRQPWLTSDADEELLLVLRFTSPVRVRKILIVGGGGESEVEGDEELAAHPSRLSCFVNRHEIDFGNVRDMEATQEFDLMVNTKGDAELTTRVSAFSEVTSLALYFSANHGDVPRTLLRYVGLQGEHSHHRREAVHTEYELLCCPHGAGLGNSHVC